MISDREKLEYLANKAREYLEQCMHDNADPMDNLYRLTSLIQFILKEEAP